MLQAIVVKDTVVGPFTCRTFAVYRFILFRIPGNPRLETQVTVFLYVNSASIAAGRAFFGIGAGGGASAFEWTAVFMGIFYRIVSPRAHFMPCLAQRVSRFIKGNVFGEKSVSVTAKIIYGIEKIDTVMAFCACKLHQQGKFNFKRIIPAAEHIQGMAKIPGFTAAVPAPVCIGVRIMAAAVVPVWTGMPTGRKMFSVR